MIVNFFTSNGLTLIRAYCMLTKGVNDRVFKNI